MIVVRVELWPGGDNSRARLLYSVIIRNIGGTASQGSYEAIVSKRLPPDAKDYRAAQVWRRLNLTGFRRKKFGALYLLGRALVRAGFHDDKAWAQET